MTRELLILAAGMAIGATFAILMLMPAAAHMAPRPRPLVPIGSPWAYSGCRGAALGATEIQWTCEVSQ